MPAPFPTGSASKKLRILAISRAYGRQAGGMERLSYELIHALRRHPDVHLRALVRHTDCSQPLWYNRLRSAAFAILVIPQALFLAPRADVIHLGDPVLSIVGWLVRFFFRRPVAVTVHGLDINFPHPWYQRYLKLFFASFQLYLPISRHAEKEMLSQKVSGRTIVIAPGLHDRLFDPRIRRGQLEKIIGRPLSNHRILMTSGRLVPRKGHAWFISNVLPHLPKTTLYVIAGSGPASPAIQQACSSSSVSSQVILLGRAKDTSLKVLYNTADAFIQPNVSVPGDSEGFGLVLLEAASCALPVFASHIEGIPDAIHHGLNGTLLPPAQPDAWIESLSTFLQKPFRSPQARQYTLSHFSWNNQAAAYLAALKTVAQ